MNIITEKTEAFLGVFREHSLELASIFVSILSSIAGITLLLQTARPPSSGLKADYRKAPSGKFSPDKTIQKTIHVDIAGGVEKQGVYELPDGSRMNDLIEKSGGLSEQANYPYYVLHVNRAQLLQDQQKIYIPLASDSLEEISSITSSYAISQNSGNSLSEGPISINSASADELEKLPGVGKVTAEKIISDRPYESIEDLSTKKIVKKNIFDSIKTKISI